MKRSFLISLFIILGLVLFARYPVQADPVVYYFNNAVNYDPSELGNYWYDNSFSDPALELPDFSIDIVHVTAGAVFDGHATFNGVAENNGEVTGNATFNGDLSENNGIVSGTKTRRYTTIISINRSFIDSAWTVVSDGGAVDVTNATYDNTTTFQRINNGTFTGLLTNTYYFNNASSTSPMDLGNYWDDSSYLNQSMQLPNFSIDLVNIGADATFNGDAIFNLTATNQGIVTGDATFNDSSENYFNGSCIQCAGTGTVNGNATFNHDSVNAGEIVGNATFNDSSNNNGTVGGDATFVGDLSENGDRGDGTINGTAIRRYNQAISTSRNFTSGRFPWTIVANGVQVDLSGATYDATTSFTEENGGSFIYAVPTLTTASGRIKTITLTYNKTLDASSVPSSGDYSVAVNGLPVSVTQVTVSGTTVTLTLNLSSNLLSSDIVSIDYTSGLNPLRIPPIGSAATLNDQTATVSTIVNVQGNSLDLINIGSFVYALSGNTLKKINLETEAVVATINLGTSPQNIVRVGNKLYIPNFSSNNVSVVNLLNDTVSSTISVGTSPFSATVLGNKVYVANGVSNSISVIDTNSDTVTATISVGAQPRSATAVGDKLYVNNYNGQSISVIDTKTNTVLSTISVGPTPSYSLLVGTKLYVPNGSSQIKAIDTTTNTVSSTISPVGGGILRDTASFGSKLYVADSQNDRILVINTSTDSVSTTINVGDAPIDTYTIDNRLYVANNSGGSISAINMETDSVVDTVTAAAGPRAMTSRGNKLFVACQNDQSIVFVDTETLSSRLPNLVSFSSSSANGTYTAGQTIALTATFSRAVEYGSTMTVSLNSGGSATLSTVSGATLSGTYTIERGETSPDLSITAITSASVGDIFNNDKTAYSTSSSLASLNAELLLIKRNLGDTKNIAITSFASAAVGTNPEEISEPITVNGVEYIYVSNRGANTVSVIKKSDGSLFETIAVGTEPVGLSSARVGGTVYLYVANSGSNTVSVINTATNTVGTTGAVGVRPLYLAQSGGKIYVSNSLSNSVSVIDAASNTLTTTIAVGLEPRGLHVYGSYVYVANFGDSNRGGGNSLSVIDSASDTISNTILMPTGNFGTYDVTDYNGNLYVSNYRSGTIAVIDIGSGAAEATISAPGGPRAIASGQGMVYAVMFDSGTVWSINPATNMETSIITIGHTPSGITFNDGNLYVGRWQDGLIGLINVATNTARTSWPQVSVSSGGGGGGPIISTPNRSSEQTNSPTRDDSPASPTPRPEQQNPTPGPATSPNIDRRLTQRLSGRLLLAVQDRGRVWYVDPMTNLRYEISKDKAMEIFRRLSLGINNADLRRLPSRLRGRLLLAVQDRGKIWYIDASGQRHQITKDNIVDIFRRLALGISDQNLDKIPEGDLK